MSYLRTILTAAFVLLLAACSSVPYAQRASDNLRAYADAAGAPVPSFHFFTLYSWEPLSNNELAVYTRPDQAWLLDLDGDCWNLAFTNAIGLTSNLNQVMARFDKVLVGRNQMPCTIRQIRPVDLKLLKATRKQQRQISSQPRNVDAGAATH